MSSIVVTEWAKEQAFELGILAAKTDHWLEPVVEPGDPMKDYGDLEQHHRERWEETIHWSLKYGLKIKELADTQQDKEEDGFDIWWEAYSELKEAFWERWENEVKLYQCWEAAQKARTA